MFLDWVSTLKLLEHNPETHILRDFSLSVQKVLVQQIVTFLLDGSNTRRTLSSAAHVVWVMEVCGQGFCLPIEEEDSISKVITLYRNWALEPSLWPTSFNDNRQFFLQKILEHFSLLFVPRGANKEQMEKHANLCSNVLTIFAHIGRAVGPSMSTETWEIFLKLLIGITDSILCVETPVNQDTVQRKLCPQLLNVLFEMWLLSRTRNPILWEALKKRSRGWTHHISLINTWKITTFALTRRSVALLYGSSEGAETVSLSVDDSVQNLQLENEYVFYSWHRLLNLIGDPNTSLQHPPIFVAFMNGVEIFVHQYLKIGTTKPLENSRYLAPTGNTILHMFGPWLFDCIHLDRPGFEEGTALATKILCGIQFSRVSTELLPVYTSSAYSCLQHALQQDGRVLVAALVSCQGVFTCDFKGIRCLVPLFFSAIQRVLSSPNLRSDTTIPSETLRKACLHILGTLLCFPHHFGDTRFATSSENSPSQPSEWKSYSDLKPQISSLLLDALGKESHPVNIELLLNLSYTWVCEEISFSPDFARQVISLVVRKLSQAHWSPEVIKAALHFLERLSSIYPKIPKAEAQANLIVDQLCRFITSQLSSSNQPGQHDLIALAFQSIGSWVEADQWILQFRETRLSLLSTIVAGLRGGKTPSDDSESQNLATSSSAKEQHHTSSTKENILKKMSRGGDKKKASTERSIAHFPPSSSSSLDEKSTSSSGSLVSTGGAGGAGNTSSGSDTFDRVREAAHYVLVGVLNRLGMFPNPSGSTELSTLVTETDLLQDLIEKTSGSSSITTDSAKEYLRYYITEDRLIFCVVDRNLPGISENEKNPSSCVIIRDRFGRYCWYAHLEYVPSVGISNGDGSPNNDNGSTQSLDLEACQPRIIPSSLATPLWNRSETIDSGSGKRGDLNEILSYLNGSGKTSSALNSVEKHLQKELQVLEKTNFRLDSTPRAIIPLPADPYNEGECKIHYSRMLFSHLGHFSMESRSKFFPLNMNPEFYKALLQLDQLSERLNIQVGVMFARKGQTLPSEWVSNPGGSLDFQEFITTLGWGVDISSHHGFVGAYESNTDSIAPYYATSKYEMIFQVATLMPEQLNESRENHVRRVLQGVCCVVVWVEDLSGFKPHSLWDLIPESLNSNSPPLVIAVSPLSFGLYSVRLFTKSSVFGPLVDGSVVSKLTLGSLVRATAIRTFQEEQGVNTSSPSQHREDAIEKIYQRFKVTCTLEQFYLNQFSSLPADQTGPNQMDFVPMKRIPNVLLTQPERPVNPSPSSSVVNPASGSNNQSVDSSVSKGKRPTRSGKKPGTTSWFGTQRSQKPDPENES